MSDLPAAQRGLPLGALHRWYDGRFAAPPPCDAAALSVPRLSARRPAGPPHQGSDFCLRPRSEALLRSAIDSRNAKHIPARVSTSSTQPRRATRSRRKANKLQIDASMKCSSKVKTQRFYCITPTLYIRLLHILGIRLDEYSTPHLQMEGPIPKRAAPHPTRDRRSAQGRRPQA